MRSLRGPGFVTATMAMLVVSAAVLGVLVLSLAGCGASLERVKLDGGTVSGERAGDLWVFKGIPYAAAPVGELRWRPPRPVAPWDGVRTCMEFGPACPQPSQAETAYLAVGETSEDCLYLNVWTPAGRPADGLPVMVWIHGGSFETGAGSMSVYDGAELARRGVVVVTINYRLGPLGFLSHASLSAESSQGISGNYGLLDQIAALKWVKTNIAGFGGDAGNVTVYGESAGAISILDLLVSPAADDLFERAIVQSGILLDRGFGVSTAATLDEAEVAGAEYAERLGIDPADSAGAAKLRALTPEELLADPGPGGGLMATGLTWKPVADGYILPDLPSVLWTEGRRHTVPLLIGSNKDEGNLFLQGLTLSPSEFNRQIRQIFGEHADEALSLYPVEGSDDIVPAFSRMLTEVGFASTARFAARSMSGPVPASGEVPGADAAPVFLYQFTRVPFNNPLGAFHGVEIPYVFGNAGQFSVLGAIDQADLDLSEEMMGYWTRFAATGDPNGEDAPLWPMYDVVSDRHLELGDSITEGARLYETACDLADKVRGLQ